MHLDEIFFRIMIYLLAAVVSVPIAKKIGLGSVLGYLIAGIVIGPFALGLVGSEGEGVMHIAEFGVVIMLFIVGLELHPGMLWRMKRLIFGLGGMQIGFTALVFALITALFWLDTAQAITTGLILALSSTAIVLQTLTEKGMLQTRGGRHSFSVLLMQDISVVPIFAIIALLANQVVTDSTTVETADAVSGWYQLLIILAAVATIIIGGRYLANYIFKFIAETGLRELFTATALLLVIGIAVFMDAVGLSPALGTFLAGVVLANSEYRYELENNLEPFKGLLLGVFFISVGASINFHLLLNHWMLILVILTILVSVKLIILWALGRLFKLEQSHNMLFTFSLAQAGEFGFVLITFATQSGVYDEFTSGILLIVVALSMLITPVLFIINEQVIQPRLIKSSKHDEDEVEDNGHPVIIAGFGRFGQVLGRFLNANGIKLTIIDNNPHNVQYLKKFGYKVYFGDITRRDMLEAAGAGHAKVLAITMSERDQIDKLVALAQKHYPNLKLIVRAVDVAHELALQNIGVDGHRQAIFDSAIELGTSALVTMGHSNHQSYRSALTFKHLDKRFMKNLQQRYSIDDPHFLMETKKFAEHLENILLMQQKHPYQEMDCAWDTDSLIEEAREYNEQIEGK
ncbi:monovalent cation:proton antiporter-2 (CPA2) family protein [Carboxylicivirga mesophila]|uniref:Monovalent cation:proton antiporter-2 (CPA2) family protein n=1 Tax=Carboxylicivirga mesophila TaxID=1166478 RepID=A0ABS5KDZ8_9BACT|nr:monovalent cation:proton antiporter-2 (CPA2) family protein [Carboxylicivirga mesophila]MBS2213249.1 monovalent cation:proton antiporter-2 (CPA2) family protein [Carboxylicivirga mesophila]